MADEEGLQTIEFKNNNGCEVSSSSVAGKKVSIKVSPLDHNSALGCPALVTKSITDYPFVVPGQFTKGVAVHRSSEFIAFAINKTQSTSHGNTGMVRVINTSSGKRGLIKGANGQIMDLSFCWDTNSIVLAFIDECGHFFVYKIEEREHEDKLSAHMLLHVGYAQATQDKDATHRVNWCRYVPEETSDDQMADLIPPYLLVVTHGNVVEIWQTYKISANNESITIESSSQDTSNSLACLYKLDSTVTCPVLSPDGSCIAIASTDGIIRFFQIEDNVDGEAVVLESEDCVHEWCPCENSPITFLTFLDDYTVPSPAGKNSGAFWKQALTGSHNNTVIRIWECSEWTCIQELRFDLPLSAQSQFSPSQPSASAPPSTTQSPALRGTSLSPSLLSTQSLSKSSTVTPASLNIFIDDTSSYLVCTDKSNEVAYVIILSSALSNAKLLTAQSLIPSEEEPLIKALSITQLPLQFSPLCLIINSAKFKNYSQYKHDELFGDNESMNRGEEDMLAGLVMHWNVLSPKSVLQCLVMFQPNLPDDYPGLPNIVVNSAAGNTVVTSSGDLKDVHDGFTDVSLSISLSEEGEACDANESAKEDQPPPMPSFQQASSKKVSPPPPSVVSTLLSPDHFTTSSSQQQANTTSDLDSSLHDNKPNDTLKALLYSAQNPAAFLSSVTNSNITSASDAQSAVLASLLKIDSVPPLPEPLLCEAKDNDPIKSVAVNAAACSSTSSPSLEIQQILHLNNPEAGSCSSDNSSRGPTQLEMAEEDGHLVISASSAVDAQTSSTPTGASGLLSTSQSNEDQPEALRQVPSQSSSSDNLTTLLQKQLNIASQPDAGNSYPPPPSDLPPQPTNLLQQLFNVDISGSTGADTSASPIAVPTPNVPISDLLRAGDSLSRLTCEALEAKIREPTSVSPAAVSVANGLGNKVLMDLPVNEPDASLNQSYSSSSSEESAANVTVVGKADYHLLQSLNNDGVIEKDDLKETSTTAAVSQPDIAKENTSASTASVRQSSVLNGATALNGRSDPYTNVSDKKEAVTRSVAPQACSIGVQVVPPPAEPPVVICQHTENSNSAELQELRNMLRTTQHQITVLTKKIEDIGSKQNKQQITPQQVATYLKPHLEASVKTEIRNTLHSIISKTIDNSMGNKVSAELQRLVLDTESRLTDNILHVINSKPFSDSMGRAVSNAITPTVTDACKDAYTKLVLPGFSSLTTKILQQFNELYHKGTSEYIMQVKSEVSGVVQCIESCKSSTVREMEANKAALGAVLKVHQDMLQQHQAAMQRHSMHTVNEATLRRTVAEEVTRILGAMKVSNPQAPPAPSNFYPAADKAHSPKQIQLQLEQLIAAKQFNSAFKQALSANDLSQVLFVCERVNRESLMTAGSSKLTQEVLLSLINQLSHDLNQKTDLKMKFLEDAVLCIDPSHPITQEHISTVATSLHNNLKTFLDTNPPLQVHNRFKMLMLAASNHINRS